jgi:BirA family transcriptional regulator, biotin operon repressor / biotin---[acetyl-CoA-carboxylase] ligase
MVGRIVPDLRFADARWVEETDSTNSQLLAAARAGAPEGRVLVADHQTAGRGRLGRRWESPAGASLLVSVLLRPDLPPGRAHLVTMAAALAAFDAVEQLTGQRPSLKWPNDLVYEHSGRTWKLAGLLSETLVDRGRLRALVVGMGMNVDARPTDDAEAVNTFLGGPATGEPVGRRTLLDAWLCHLDARLDDLAGVLFDYRRRCSTLGRPVRVTRSEGDLEGRAVDVSDDGHLLVEAGGEVVEVAVGDVLHLRPREPGSAEPPRPAQPSAKGLRGPGRSPPGGGRPPSPSR